MSFEIYIIYGWYNGQNLHAVLEYPFSNKCFTNSSDHTMQLCSVLYILFEFTIYLMFRSYSIKSYGVSSETFYLIVQYYIEPDTGLKFRSMVAVRRYLSDGQIDTHATVSSRIHLCFS